MFERVLIANRGAIACRIERTLHRLGIESVAVYAADDRDSLHVRNATVAVPLAGERLSDTYLNGDRLIECALAQRCAAVHPGYGFLSERAQFAQRCEDAGLVFLGPRAEQIRAFGLKHEAKALALANAVPTLTGTPVLNSLDEALTAAETVGYPIMLKSSAGGGGIGMRVCEDAAALCDAWASVTRLAGGNFDDSRLFVERYVRRARHVEVQLFGDGNGEVVVLGDRDCSLQRRNQKVIEEAPAPNLPLALRERMHAAARRLLAAVAYRSAGTVEFIYDVDNESVAFLEVNTRLQVEHGVTELITGVDLVEWMIRLGAGEPLANITRRRANTPHGSAMQARVYAEDAEAEFRPSSGTITHASWPPDVRADTWVEANTAVSAKYDPLLAKLIAGGVNREAAREKLAAALASAEVYGVNTNLRFLRAALALTEFRSANPHTALLSSLVGESNELEVVAPGTLSTLQDLGRSGYWHVGVPPSGPMDDRSHRRANALVGNSEHAVVLEVTAVGPTLRFRRAARIAICGAEFGATLDDQPVANDRMHEVSAGQVLRLPNCAGPGQRATVAIAGGFKVPAYLGSGATFTLGQFGGHAGRALRTGDVLEWHPIETGSSINQLPPGVSLDRRWTLRVRVGPHAAPEFLSQEAIDDLLSAEWRVHPQSSRTGVRLIGPTPQWARSDGGEAGLHPSNIHDTPYTVGAVDFTGDMPVILGPDGPSLGGFVCPLTVIRDDLWMLGQMRADDAVSFCLDGPRTPLLRKDSAVLRRGDAVIRQAGDAAVLVEYGEQQLDLRLRFKVEALSRWLEANRFTGMLELTAGVRGLQVRFAPEQVGRERVLDHLERAIAEASDQVRALPSRVVHLPLSWDDPSTRVAIERYTRTVRSNAPWCPSNIEFIRRINGLRDIEEVFAIVHSAEYLVLGLGDVYLGAPVATPLDPRHRLVTTKYNPARTWTPENAVGIGGAYLCVYGMEGPGGYQFVGRTIQMWSRCDPPWGQVDAEPWLLRNFDRIRFYPVSSSELDDLRHRAPSGQFRPRVEEGQFSIDDYEAFLRREATSIEAWRGQQQRAFAAERARWQSIPVELVQSTSASDDDASAPLGCRPLLAPVSGLLTSQHVDVGARICCGQRIATIEAMKMEIEVDADCDGRIERWRVQPGGAIGAGQPIAWVRP